MESHVEKSRKKEITRGKTKKMMICNRIVCFNKDLIFNKNSIVTNEFYQKFNGFLKNHWF